MTFRGAAVLIDTRNGTQVLPQPQAGGGAAADEPEAAARNARDDWIAEYLAQYSLDDPQAWDLRLLTVHASEMRVCLDDASESYGGLGFPPIEDTELREMVEERYDAWEARQE